MNFLEKAYYNKTSSDDMAVVVQGGGMRKQNQITLLTFGFLKPVC